MVRLSVLTLALLSACAASGPDAPLPQSLVDVPVTRIAGMLGAPQAIHLTQQQQAWQYPDASGAPHAMALIVTNGRVSFVDPSIRGFARPTPIPEQGAYLGQPLQELTERFGAATKTTSGALSTLMQFANGLEVNVADGVIVQVLSKK